VPSPLPPARPSHPAPELGDLASAAAGAARDLLTQVEAEARATRVSDVSYQLALELTRGAERYRGDVTIRFRLSGDGDTFLDFRGGKIEALEVDGAAVEPAWTGYRLALPASALTGEGEHVARVRYESEYDHTGDGFHQFVDPEDGEEYLYTNFEPYAAHRLLPCFDQPDLKGRFSLSVTAPEAWELIANGAPEEQGEPEAGRRRWSFAETPPIATYLFALIAGPYHAIRSEHDGVPLGLYCRRSLVRFLDEDEVLEVTRQGLTFFAEFFDYSYPFGKYDQVFVPEFNAGAMENVAAVTHSERLIFRDPPTENQRLTRGEVILHEMAHMWFGDLVTMRWWNDLWLNESFATYMAYLALTEATRFDTAWQSFNSGMKAWAYRQDQLVTTHPIAGEVASTEETFLNFDGITYGKGAAVIKQLVAAMGIEGFRAGMRLYFQRHAFGNTTLVEFLDALQDGMREAGGERDLHAWAALWLKTPSLNTLAASWEPEGGEIGRLVLAQSAPEAYPTLRPHHLELGLWREDDRGTLSVEALPASIDGAEAEVAAAAGRPAPLFVLPNHDDHAYSKLALDDASLVFARERLPEIADPLSRQLSWRALWDMVRDQQLSSLDYLEVVSRHLGVERDVELVETLLATAQGAIARYVPEEQKLAAAHAFFERAWELLPKLPPGDLQILWARALIQITLSPDDIELTGALADGELDVPGLAIDQAMRWEISARYTAYSLDGAEARAAAERERDPSDRGQRALLRIDVSPPDAAAKAAAWERLLGEGYGSLHLTGAAMSGFHWSAQRELLAPYVERFFEVLPGVARDRDHEFAQAFFGQLFPGYRVERELLERSRLLLAEVEAEPLLARMLREANDDLERAIRCREFAQAQG
jgi:aminopeptidase N